MGTAVIVGVYVLGIVLFAYTLGPWTDAPASLYWRAPEGFWRGAVGQPV